MKHPPGFAAAAASSRRLGRGLEVTANPAEVRRWRHRVVAVADRLEQIYGSPRLGNVKDPTRELFYILLSNRSDPRRCASAFREFRTRFYPWRRLLRVSIADIQDVLRPLGMDRVRAERILSIAARLQADFGGVSLARLRGWPVQEALGYLTALPGVGEKSARCVLMYSFGHDVSPVDTHQLRVLSRLGLLPGDTTPKRAHDLLDNRLPHGIARRLHVNLVAHGRAICAPRWPRCGSCPLRLDCDHVRATAML
jgi:endonuclease III